MKNTHTHDAFIQIWPIGIKSETLLLLKGTQLMPILLIDIRIKTLKTLPFVCMRIYQQDIQKLVTIVVKVKPTSIVWSCMAIITIQVIIMVMESTIIKVWRIVHSSMLVHIYQLLPGNSQRITHTLSAIDPFLVVHCIMEAIRGPNTMTNHIVYP